MLLRPLLAVALTFIGCACSRAPNVAPIVHSKPIPADASWIGIYSSPGEIGGFSGTVLAIEKKGIDRDDLGYRMTFHSDVVISGSIEEPEKSGDVLTDGDHIYVPVASGYYDEGKPRLSAYLTRYTRVTLRGRIVLLRDDALKTFQEENRLYDYGVLIKVSDTVEWNTKLEDAKHESIKVLYEDASKGWKDPFVHGPNPR